MQKFVKQNLRRWAPVFMLGCLVLPLFLLWRRAGPCVYPPGTLVASCGSDRALPALMVWEKFGPVILTPGGGDSTQRMLEFLHNHGITRIHRCYLPGNTSSLRALARMEKKLSLDELVFYGQFRKTKVLLHQQEERKPLGFQTAILPSSQAKAPASWTAPDGRFCVNRWKPEWWSWRYIVSDNLVLYVEYNEGYGLVDARLETAGGTLLGQGTLTHARSPQLLIVQPQQLPADD